MDMLLDAVAADAGEIGGLALVLLAFATAHLLTCPAARRRRRLARAARRRARADRRFARRHAVPAARWYSDHFGGL